MVTYTYKKLSIKNRERHEREISSPLAVVLSLSKVPWNFMQFYNKDKAAELIGEVFAFVAEKALQIMTSKQRYFSSEDYCLDETKLRKTDDLQSN